MTEIVAPFQQFFDTSGAPLANGMIYIGAANLDAETNPIAVFWDEALTIPAAQPIRTLNGYPARNGAPARLYANAASYSVTVRNAQGRLMYSELDITAASSLDNFQAQLASSSGSNLIGFIQSESGAVLRTAQAKMRDIISVMDFGALGNGIADDTAAIQAALSSGAVRVYIPAGRYRITADLTRSGHTLMTGDGLAASVLIFEGESKFIYSGGWAGNEWDTKLLQIEKLGFEIPTLTSKRVISAVWQDGIGGTSKTFIMRDCEICANNASGGFGSAVYLENARNVVVESVRILGDRDGAPISSGNGFEIYGGTTSGAPVELFFNSVQVFFVQNFAYISGWVEGINFNSCTGIACYRGILGFAIPEGKPWVVVRGCHFNTDQVGIRLVGFCQLNISQNLIYAQNGDGTSTEYVGIQSSCGPAIADSLICDNIFKGILTGIPKNAIVVLDSSPGTIDNFTISRNIIDNFDTGIWLQPNVTFVLVTGDNVIRNTGNSIFDQGTNNSIARFGEFTQTNNSGLVSVVAENASSAASMNKYVGYTTRGRDTVGSQKNVGALYSFPQDPDWVNAGTYIYGRNADALAPYAILGGNGSPEGVITAPVGAIYTRRDGGASSTLYVKQSGTGNTGWVAK